MKFWKRKQESDKHEPVLLAILDKDLKARTFKKFPLTSNGNKIDVTGKGKGYFRPAIDNHTFIELPQRSRLPPFKITWQRIYIAVRGAKNCINFHNPNPIEGPDPEQVIDAAKAEIVTSFGKEKQDLHPVNLIMFLIIIGTALKVFGVLP